MRQSWTWELVELSGLFGVVAVVDLVRSGPRAAGVVLGVVAVVFVVAAVVVRRARATQRGPVERLAGTFD